MGDGLILPKFEGDDLYRFNVSAKSFTWFKTGGTIEVFFRPRNIDNLSYFLSNFPDKSLIKILGACSNVIIRDGGIDGVVIRLGRDFNYIKQISDTELEVGAATIDFNVAQYAMDFGIGGLEFLASIPGTIGGNVRMNAGCYGSDISSILVEYEAVDMDGNVCKFKKEDINFSYRCNPKADGYIVTKAILKGHKESTDNIKEKMLHIKAQREQSQPVKSSTGGSTFVNPKDKKAWELIDACGLRGAKIGGAQVSVQHCNFLINNGTATSADIEGLGELIRSKVLQKFGINLEWEIERYGKI